MTETTTTGTQSSEDSAGVETTKETVSRLLDNPVRYYTELSDLLDSFSTMAQEDCPVSAADFDDLMNAVECVQDSVGAGLSWPSWVGQTRTEQAEILAAYTAMANGTENCALLEEICEAIDDFVVVPGMKGWISDTGAKGHTEMMQVLDQAETAFDLAITKLRQMGGEF